MIFNFETNRLQSGEQTKVKVGEQKPRDQIGNTCVNPGMISGLSRPIK